MYCVLVDLLVMIGTEQAIGNIAECQVHSSLRNLTAADFEAVKLIWQKNGTVKSPAISTSRRFVLQNLGRLVFKFRQS